METGQAELRRGGDWWLNARRYLARLVVGGVKDVGFSAALSDGTRVLAGGQGQRAAAFGNGHRCSARPRSAAVKAAVDLCTETCGEAIEVSLSARADWQFRTAVEIMRSLARHDKEFYALLVVCRAAPLTVRRLEFPVQHVSAASCEVAAEDLRAVRDSLRAEEAIAGSIHFHPMSTRSERGFLSSTDYELLEQMSLEQAAEVLVPVASPGATFTLPEGSRLSADGEVLVCCERPRVIRIEPAVSGVLFAAHTFCLVNAGENYYGKVVRASICSICGHQRRVIHPADVRVLREESFRPSEYERLELFERLEECVETTARARKKERSWMEEEDKEKARRESREARRRALAARAIGLVEELWELLGELEENGERDQG